jgi:hypothetical protein
MCRGLWGKLSSRRYWHLFRANQFTTRKQLVWGKLQLRTFYGISLIWQPDKQVMTKKAIDATEFGELLLEQQLRVLHREGVYIGKRKAGEQMVVLFQVAGFYVEVFYRHYRREVERLLITESADVLTPYLHQVNVRDLDAGKKTGDQS